MADQPGDRQRQRASVDELEGPRMVGRASVPDVTPSNFPALLAIVVTFIVVMVILSEGSFQQVTASDPASVEGAIVGRDETDHESRGERAAETTTLPAGSGPEEAAAPTTDVGVEISDGVAGAKTAGVIVNAAQTSLALVGTVSNHAIVEELVARAELIYPSDQVDSRLLVDEATPIPMAITVQGSLTDPVLFERITTGFSGIVGVEIVVTDDFVLVESSELEHALNALAPIRFRSGWSFISPESLPTLEQVAAMLNDNPDMAIEIGGHTDSNGSEEVNQVLSQFRADAVRDQLVALGVTNKMQTRGFGESRLRVSPEDSDEARRANRRIEFRIID